LPWETSIKHRISDVGSPQRRGGLYRGSDRSFRISQRWVVILEETSWRIYATAFLQLPKGLENLSMCSVACPPWWLPALSSRKLPALGNLIPVPTTPQVSQTWRQR
jgi:hypothetical protein